jgi:adenine-specific DNA-methyltransferase
MAKKAKPTQAPKAASPAPAKPVAVKVSAAKGRPMLTWVGKRPLGQVQAFPAQEIERFEAGPASPHVDWSGWPAKYPQGGLLYHGDNKEVLIHLLANGFRGKVQLIYIDPPFDSGADYVRKVTLRGPSGTAKVEGETYTLGEQIQYQDIWANDNYLQFMYERLLLLKELLVPSGSIYLHCDPRRSAYLRVVMDEVFGAEAFQNEVIWKRTNAHNMPSRAFVRSHDSILLYAKGDSLVFTKQFTEYGEQQLSRYKDDESGRPFTGRDLTFSTVNANRQFEWRGTRPPANRSWGYALEDLEALWREGRILTKRDGTPRLDGLKVFLDEAKGTALTSIWTDVDRVGNTASERTDYPTQKPVELLDRILRTSSKPGDLVLDCFLGSGTTAAVAQKLGRRWIGCDINKGAIQTTVKRLQAVMAEQAAAQANPEATQGSFIDKETPKDEPPAPAQLSLSVWRVNDYDLQVQHNEAVGLACEYLGIERTRTDRFFDGTRGRSLVKIVPFNHPLSPVDLEVLKGELDARKDEDRSITFVCLGIELAAQAAIEEWNRLRKGKHAPNHIEVIELRHDPKHGGWLDHQPAQADVRIVRKGQTAAVVTIDDFISPSIVERLRQQAGVLNPKIEDCRAMIDSVAIDPAYDGRVLNLAVVDVPEKKDDLVLGTYNVKIPKGPTTVAVRITDMLGEEVLVTKSLK